MSKLSVRKRIRRAECALLEFLVGGVRAQPATRYFLVEVATGAAGQIEAAQAAALMQGVAEQAEAAYRYLRTSKVPETRGGYTSPLEVARAAAGAVKGTKDRAYYGREFLVRGGTHLVLVAHTCVRGRAKSQVSSPKET